MQLENVWLSHCPRPQFLIHDQGLEFMGKGLRAVLRQYRIYDYLTIVKNPKANAICECLHQTMTNVLHLFLHIHPLQDINEVDFVMDTILQAAFIQLVLLFTTFYRLLQVHQHLTGICC